MTTGAMSLEEALKEITRIAERYERDMAACALAARIDRDRRDALYAEATASGTGGGHEPV